LYVHLGLGSNKADCESTHLLKPRALCSRGSKSAGARRVSVSSEVYYLDTSAVVKRFVAEPGSEVADEVFKTHIEAQ
jgi:hypothetical protein